MIMFSHIDARGAALADAIRVKLNATVFGGPFRGMKLPQMSGNYCPQLLGTYEHELWPVLEEIKATHQEHNKYKSILNIGCSWGYYAVGLKRMLCSTNVVACDVDDSCLQLCEETSKLNDVNLNYIKTYNEEPFDLIIMDVEGAEEQYLANPAKFLRTDILVELHDHEHPGLAQKIFDDFAPSHHIKIIYNSPKYFDLATIFPGPDIYLEHFDNAIATFEGRAAPTPWLWMKHK